MYLYRNISFFELSVSANFSAYVDNFVHVSLASSYSIERFKQRPITYT